MNKRQETYGASAPRTRAQSAHTTQKSTKKQKVNTDKEALEAWEMSQYAFKEVWDNDKDSIYDKL